MDYSNERTLCDDKTDVLNQSERINQSRMSKVTSVSVYCYSRMNLLLLHGASNICRKWKTKH